MSFIPSQYLVRLQELKLWQGNYDNLLQKQKNKSEEEVFLSDSDELDGITPLSEPRSSPKSKLISYEPVDWDKQAILPAIKPFHELLEEKIAADQPTKISIKAKQPFLKKGAGLARYKLGLNGVIYKNKTVKDSKVRFKNGSKEKKSKQIELNNCQNSLTPLKAPDLSIKCKATWTKVNHEGETPEQPKHPINMFNPHYVIDKINEFAQSFRSPKKSELKRDLQISPHPHYNEKDTSYSNKSERELRLFEALEEKVGHSSFVSTNSSIHKLLASTHNSNHISLISKANNEELNVCQELCSSEVLTKILNNLKLISSENGCSKDIHSQRSSPDTSFSEGRKSSGNSESICHSVSSFYTDFENTLQLEKINAAVNTSFSDKKDDSCTNCSKLRDKLQQLVQEKNNAVVDRKNLYDFEKELERQRDIVNEEIKKMKKNYARDVEDLRQELDEEKKKFARERALLDMYIKDVRPKKKECIEIENLKKELIDLKEILKLKETKNGTTQARLRNQIKQLEKDKAELKSSVEYLQKENAKLNATQKVHRNAEARMLQEISRNLNKLTEETVRGESAPTNGGKDKPKTQKRIKRRSMGELREKVEKELQLEVNKSKNQQQAATDGNERVPPTIEVIYNNELIQTSLGNQQESSQGLVNGEFAQNENSHHFKKIFSEKEFSDGSREIKFVNGTSKTISPDGTHIYLQYANGDIRETNLEKNIQKYFFVKKNIWLTKYGDGTELIEFPNGQKEERFIDGKVQVTTLDGTTLTTFPEGTQEINYPDGSKMVKEKEEKIIYLPNGQKETHTPDYKKREYPDGTVKIIYPDGTQESRYANGRIRIKDESGTLLMDSHLP